MLANYVAAVADAAAALLMLMPLLLLLLLLLLIGLKNIIKHNSKKFTATCRLACVRVHARTYTLLRAQARCSYRNYYSYSVARCKSVYYLSSLNVCPNSSALVRALAYANYANAYTRAHAHAHAS